MVCKTHTYANGGQIKAYADGGQVKKLKPHTPAKVKSPILEKAPNPGGEQTPGAKAKAKKMADGGPVKKKKAPRKPKPSDLGTGLAATAASELQNRRKQQMKDLDI